MNRPILQAVDICKSYGFHEIIRGINLILREEEKVGLVGPNGVGKSTLLKILAGIEAPTSGSVNVFKEQLTLGYVPQDPAFDLMKTSREILTEKEAILGPAARSSVEEVLSRFRLAGDEGDLCVANLSGGQKTRLALALVWMERPDILLLDEPTNHLDQDGLVWLERFVRDYPGTVMVVSHDRYFLDTVISRVIELAPDRATEYYGNYTSYRDAKAKAFADQSARYESEQKEIRRIETAIDRKMRWVEKSHRHAGEDSDIRKGAKEFYRARAKRMARRAKSTIKRLEAMKKVSVEKPEPEKTISLGSFKEGAVGRRVILADEISKSFDRLLFGPSSFSVAGGKR